MSCCTGRAHGGTSLSSGLCRQGMQLLGQHQQWSTRPWSHSTACTKNSLPQLFLQTYKVRLHVWHSRVKPRKYILLKWKFRWVKTDLAFDFPCDSSSIVCFTPETESCIFYQASKVKEETNCWKAKGWQDRDAREYFIAEGSRDAGFGRPKSRGNGLMPGCSYERLPWLLCNAAHTHIMEKKKAFFPPHFILGMNTPYSSGKKHKHLSAAQEANRHWPRGHTAIPVLPLLPTTWSSRAAASMEPIHLI